jgi:hypothetical protein
MTELKPLMDYELAKNDRVAIANPANPSAYLTGIVTVLDGKQITVETDEAEYFFALDGTERRRGKNRIYALDDITKRLNAIADAKEGYRNDLIKSIDDLLEGATVLRLEKALKMLRGE